MYEEKCHDQACACINKQRKRRWLCMCLVSCHVRRLVWWWCVLYSMQCHSSINVRFPLPFDDDTLPPAGQSGWTPRYSRRWKTWERTWDVSIHGKSRADIEVRAMAKASIFQRLIRCMSTVGGREKREREQRSNVTYWHGRRSSHDKGGQPRCLLLLLQANLACLPAQSCLPNLHTLQ